VSAAAHSFFLILPEEAFMAERSQVPVIALDQLTEAATLGVMRAIESRSNISKEFLRRPILVGIIIQPPDLNQELLEQLQNRK
jgi:hypothetical protein